MTCGNSESGPRFRQHPLVELGEHLRPGLLVAGSGLLVWEAGVAEPKPRAVGAGRKLDRDHGLGALGPSLPGEPGQLDQATWLQSQEATVVGMALPADMGLEEEGGVDLRLH